MASKKIIKRIVTKSGIRYYIDGKRVTSKSGQRRFLKQNPNVSKDILSDAEKKALDRSKKALETYKKGWKFKGVAKVPFAYVDILTKLAIIDPKNIKDKDLYNVFQNGKRRFNNFEDIKKLIDDRAKKSPLVFQWCNEVGLPNFRGRDFETFTNNKIQNIVDIVDLLKSTAYKQFTLIVIDRDGDMQVGRVLGLLALRDFEIAVGTEIQAMVSNSAFLRFCYDYKIILEKKEIIIDLTDLKPNENPTETEEGGEGSLKSYIDNAQGTGKGEQLMIKGKYKDVEITIEFS
jgi:hypothetical protein